MELDIKAVTREEHDRLCPELEITIAMRRRYQSLIHMAVDATRRGLPAAIITNTIGTHGKPLNWIYYAEVIREDVDSKILGVGFFKPDIYGSIPFNPRWLKPKMFKYFSFRSVVEKDFN